MSLDDHFSYDFIKYQKCEEKVELQTPEGGWLNPEIPENSKTCTALRVRISLPSSSYATVAVRELLRSDDVTKSFS